MINFEMFKNRKYDQYISETDLEPLLQFSNEQFNKAKKNPNLALPAAAQDPSSLDAWKERLYSMHGTIYTSESKDQIIGLLFSCDKGEILDGYKTRHIWLAITHGQYQRKGIMRSLFEMLENDVKKDAQTL